MVFSSETRKAKLEYRIRLMIARGEADRIHLIAKLKREIRNIERGN